MFKRRTIFMNTIIRDIMNDLKHSEDKINFAQIARRYNCDYRTVKRYYENDLKETVERKKRIIPKLIDGYEEIIKKKVDYSAPAIAIYNFLKEKGYKGGYSTIKNYVKNYKDERVQQATVRFETSPGLQCQIDWKESLILINKLGEPITINIFLAILGYSRKKYIRLTLDRSQETLFFCLYCMIKYFNGVPHELLFDNMRTVVDQSRTQFGEPHYNSKFVQFSRDCGFIPKSCIAYRPKTKGKVETVAKIMNRLKVQNEEFLDIEELNEIVIKLNEEINSEIQATTREIPTERFEKEKEYLLPCPKEEILNSYYSKSTTTRKVPKDCLVSFKNKRYSVPPKFSGKIVECVEENNYLHIYYNEILIAKHEISTKNINYLPEHYKALMSLSYSDQLSIDDLCNKNLELFDKLLK